jgi:putative transposase
MRKNAMTDASDAQWAAAVARERVVRFLAAQSPIRRSDIDAAAEELHLSRAMLYRLLARYRRDPHTAALVVGSPGRKTGSQMFDQRIQTIVRDCIRGFYLTAEKPTVMALYRAVCHQCSISGLTSPSYNTIRARVNAVDLKDLILHRVGPKAARDRFRPVSASSLRPERPLDLFQIDHTWMDIIVVDEVERKPLGRPWLTVVIDVATRMIAGYYLSFDHPSSSSVALALSRAVLPKDRHLERFNVTADWPVCGLPAAVHLDNAEEFHARALERGCQEHGIRLEFRPPLRPHYGGHIERLIGNLMKATHALPGTTFSSSQEKGEYDSEGRAVIALGELETWLLLQIAGVYHRRFHRGLGSTPLEAWKQGWDRAQARYPRDPERFYIDFLPFERRKIRRDGIQLLYIHYWDNALSVLAGRSEDQVVLRYDPHDLSRIFIKESQSDGYLAIPYRDLSPSAHHTAGAAIRAEATRQEKAADNHGEQRVLDHRCPERLG